MEMRAVYASCMAEMMEKDKRVCLLDADLAKCFGTTSLHTRFPEQAFNCGIAEQNMASVAAGLASYGFKPYIESFSPFASRRICDQIALSIAYAKSNVKIIGADPGITAEINGGTHMGLDDVGVLRSIPDLVIFEPVDEIQLRAAMPVINEYEGCLYMRLFRKQTPLVFKENYKFDLFTADVLREGSDVSIFASGMMMADALSAAEALAAEGINAEVINIHTLKPIDRETVITSACKTGAVVTAENHNIIGGLRSAVLEALAEERVPVCGIGVNDRFGEVGRTPYLRKIMGLSPESISAAARKAISFKQKH